MSKSRIQIVMRNCPRCKKPVAGLSRSIHGSAAAHAKFAGLCSSCATEEEKQEILHDQAMGILDQVAKDREKK